MIQFLLSYLTSDLIKLCSMIKTSTTRQIAQYTLSIFPWISYISYSNMEMLNNCDHSYEITVLLDKTNIRNTVCRKHTNMNLLEWKLVELKILNYIKNIKNISSKCNLFLLELWSFYKPQLLEKNRLKWGLQMDDIQKDITFAQ